MNLQNKKPALFWLMIITAVSAIYCFFSIRAGQHWGDDFALYIRQAIAIAHGTINQLVENNSCTVNLSSYPFGPITYPWGYPLLLVPVYLLFGLNIFAMQIVTLFLFIASLPVIYLLFQKRVGSNYALMIIALLAFNPIIIFELNNIGSDFPHLFFVFLSLLLIQNSRENPKSLLLPAGTGIAIFGACAIRSNAFVLIMVLLASQVKVWRKFLLLERFAKIRLFLPWIIMASGSLIFYLCFGHNDRATGSYVSALPRLTIPMFLDHLRYYAQLPSECYGSFLPEVLYGISLPFMVRGVLRNYYKDADILIYIALTLGVLLVWPYIEGVRFILPLLPFFFYYLVAGIQGFRGFAFRLGKRSLVLKPWLIVVLIAFSVCFLSDQRWRFAVHNMRFANFTAQRRTEISGPFTKSSQEIFHIIRSTTSLNDTVIFFKPRVLTLLTGRTSYMLSDSSVLAKSTASVVVLCKYMHNFDQVPFDNKIFTGPDSKFNLQYQDSLFAIYRRSIR